MNALDKEIMHRFPDKFISGELSFRRDEYGLMCLYRETDENRYHISKRIDTDGTVWYIIWGKKRKEPQSKLFFVSKHNTASEAKMALCEKEYV